MSLRGLVQTSPTGLLLFLYGYGWLPMISGIMMGCVSLDMCTNTTPPSFAFAVQ